MKDEMTHQEFFLSTHTDLIDGEVWKANRRFPDIPQEEILSEAHEVFCHCYSRWEDEKQVKFSTYLTASLKALFSNCSWYKKPTPKYLDSEQVGINGMCGPERRVRLKQALGQMSSLGVEIANAALSPPPLLRRRMREEKRPVVTKGVLRNYLRKDMGVSDANIISEAFAEIKQTLEEV
jgi:hypothetical protein